MFRAGKIAYRWIASPSSSKEREASSNRPLRHQRFWDAALIALFAALIALPGLGVFLGLGKEFDPAFEGRNPAPPPAIRMKKIGALTVPNASSLQKFPALFEPYFRDRHSFRREAMEAYLWSRMHHCTTVSQEVAAPRREKPNPESNGAEAAPAPTPVVAATPVVVVGEDGWLFFTGDRSAESYRRIHPFTFEQLERIRVELESRQARLSANGAKYLLVIAPDKGTIYPECLPAYLRGTGRSRLDQLLDHLREHSNVKCVDLRPDLREAKTDHRVYHKTDTHWNEIGAQRSCRTILRAIEHPGAERENLNRYRIVRQPFGGDEARMMGMQGSPEEAFVLEPLEPRQASFDKSAADWWITRSTVSTNKGAPPYKAMVLHDSFFVCMGPFLCEHFQEVRCLIHAKPFEPLPADPLTTFRPTHVIETLAERKLNLID